MQTYFANSASERCESMTSSPVNRRAVLLVGDKDMKTCTKCGQEKPETEFHRDRNAASGLRYTCKICDSKRPHHWADTHREFLRWCQMINRCYYTTSVSYPNYGGRGITVCERWRQSFDNYMSDMGQPPSSLHQIDRIDNNGNYEPSNCRWVTRKEQNRNTRRNVFIEYLGQRLCLTDWADKVRIDRSLLRRRLLSGWSVERALTQKPSLSHVRRKKVDA
jgi:hypothetical protein